MSLNGLDSSEVELAYATVLQGRGGWFLLHYTSRDTVDVLAQGAKGINEMRTAADGCYAMSEQGKHSPLYGMIDYKRRKVLLKLVAEGTSRLIQARVQVHWTYVTAKFAKHETIFESTSTEQWNDSNLTAHIALHSGRTSAGSGQKSGLEGIEEAEELSTPEREKEQPSSVDNSGLFVPMAFPRRTSSLISLETSNALQNSVAEEAEPRPGENALEHPQSHALQDLTKITAPHASLLPALPLSNVSQTFISDAVQRPKTPPGKVNIPEVNITMDPPTPPAPTPPPKELPETRYSISRDATTALGVDRRMSSQSVRPNAGKYDPFDPSFYDTLYKPKVKLGPRPSLTMDRRPGSAKSLGAAVATLPAGLRASRQGVPGNRQSTSSRPQSSSRSQTASRPKSRDSAMYSFKNNFPAPPPIPESSAYVQRPTSSSGSVKSLPAALTKSPAMSREKQRLMKFQQMYKDKQNRGGKIKPPAELTSKSEIAQGVLQVTEVTDDVFMVNPPLEANPMIVGGIIKLDSHRHSKSMPQDHLDISSSAMQVEHYPDTDARDESPVKNGQIPINTETAESLEEADAETGVAMRTSAATASSPTSAPESSDHNSTRPTSVSDLSEPEKEVESELESENVSEVNTPSTIEGSSLQETPTHGAGTEKPQSTSSKSQSREGGSEEEGTTPRATVEVSVSAAAQLEVPDPIEDEAKNEGGVTPTATSFPQEISDVDTLHLVSAHKESHRPTLSTLSIPRSEAGSERSFDDDLIDELQGAQVQEALPMSVSKSPITPYFPHRRPSQPILVDHVNKPRSPSRDKATPEVYKPSTHSKSPSLTPHQSNTSPLETHRSASGSSLAPITEPEELISIPKRMRIGGGVAAKIADLQRSFSRGSAVGALPTPTSLPKHTVGRKTSFMSNKSASVNENPTHSASPQAQPSQVQSSFGRGRAISKGSFDSHDTATTPSREKSSSPIGKLDNLRMSAYIPPLLDMDQKETISVRATIIRTDGPRGLDMAPPILHESPLVISHQRAVSTSAKEIQSTPVHHRTRSSISQLLPSMKSSSTLNLPGDLSPGVRESSTFPRESKDGGWRSIGRRRSKSPMGRSPASPGGLSRSMSTESVNSLATNESGKKGSKSSRLMKRMSNGFSSIASATRLPLGPLSPHSVKEEEQEQEPIESPKKLLGLDIGDLNVQFPDTLLWKRRWVEVDNNGYLVLKPPAEARTNGGVIKKYHLGEFTAPFAPDLERQEMPNSVMMDFCDGRTLQCQTQSSAAQRTVLRILGEAHRAWTS
ncbi:hypothetical protein EJ08DRAFT_654765 [Tothia fuscella]|uniref:PH domain-containing protein n=1 Tax=Tothia fuscella TaxID=1048955 RepID=A0A9P4TSG4_9PEZI|nr:hypothetical protein EJ08DRAFT_654765 [Tothia fuscella]